MRRGIMLKRNAGLPTTRPERLRTTGVRTSALKHLERPAYLKVAVQLGTQIEETDDA
jgi:hypothetical protein